MKIVVTGLRGIPGIQGGVESHCEALYPRIADAGHEVIVVRRKKFREGAKFRTWLYTVARNRAIDYVRKYGRQRTLSGLENVLMGMNGEDALLARQRNETLYICLQQLPEQYKEVLYLNYFDGFSVKEICHILKKNEKQVYNLLSRARSTLKEILVKEGYHENE